MFTSSQGPPRRGRTLPLPLSLPLRVEGGGSVRVCCVRVSVSSHVHARVCPRTRIAHAVRPRPSVRASPSRCSHRTAGERRVVSYTYCMHKQRFGSVAAAAVVVVVGGDGGAASAFIRFICFHTNCSSSVSLRVTPIHSFIRSFTLYFLSVDRHELGVVFLPFISARTITPSQVLMCRPVVLVMSTRGTKLFFDHTLSNVLSLVASVGHFKV